MILKIKNSVLLVILASYASGGFGAVKGDLSNTDEVLTPSEASVLYTTETQVEAITRIDRQLLGIQGNSNVEGSPIRCSHVLMHSTTASYDGFPSVAYFPTVEKLFSVFRSGVSHADAEGALHGMESYDFGQTWTSPYLMFDDPVRDVRDPSLLVLSDGRLFMTYTKRYNVGGTNDLRNVCFRISEDSGNTFGDEVVFNTGTNALFDVERLANSTGITELLMEQFSYPSMRYLPQLISAVS